MLVFHHPSALDHDTGGHPRKARSVCGRCWRRLKARISCSRPARGAARHPRPARAGPSGRLCRGPAGGGAQSGLVAVDADTVLSPGSGEAALRAAGAVCRRGRCGDGGRGAQRLLRRAPARPSCRGRRRRWASACSTTSAVGAAAGARGARAVSASRSSISTSITATARRTSSRTTRTCSTPRPTSRRSIPAPARGSERGVGQHRQRAAAAGHRLRAQFRAACRARRAAGARRTSRPS